MDTHALGGHILGRALLFSAIVAATIFAALGTATDTGGAVPGSLRCNEDGLVEYSGTAINASTVYSHYPTAGSTQNEGRHGIFVWANGEWNDENREWDAGRWRLLRRSEIVPRFTWLWVPYC